MATVANWRVWVAEKLNPAQRVIASNEPIVGPEPIGTYQQAYREIEIVSRCVELIINGLIEIPMVVEGRGAVKKIDKLLNKFPNPFEDRVKLFRKAFLDYILDGNTFFYYDGNGIYLLPANLVEIIPDEKTYIKEYRLTIQDSGMFRRSKNREYITYSPDEIIHIKADSEDSIFRGSPKLKSANRLIELYYSLINFQRMFFKNNGIPGVVLQTQSVLSPKVKERVLEQWKQSYSTVYGGSRSPAILDGGLELNPFGQVKFSELDFEASVERVQQDIAKAIGVPYVLLKSGNNANIAANQVLFYSHTIIPILEQFCSAFTHFFNPDFINIRPDKGSVSSLRTDEKTQALYFSTLVNTGIITPNEARAGLRYSKLDINGDEVRIPQNITGSATNPSTGGRPSDQDNTSTDGAINNE